MFMFMSVRVCVALFPRAVVFCVWGEGKARERDAAPGLDLAVAVAAAVALLVTRAVAVAVTRAAAILVTTLQNIVVFIMMMTQCGVISPTSAVIPVLPLAIAISIIIITVVVVIVMMVVVVLGDGACGYRNRECTICHATHIITIIIITTRWGSRTES